MASSSFNSSLNFDLSSISNEILNLRRQISKRTLLLEFGNSSLIYGEAKYLGNQIMFTKMNQVEIPESALELGTPIDPIQMAEYLIDLINEDQIWAHRVAVVLPPEASISKIIHLPSEISVDDAREYILRPNSGFQFPIPILKTDFDLIPLHIEKNYHGYAMKAYFLACIPQRLVDNLINTFTLANLELRRVDLSFSCQGRLALNQINKLKFNEYILILELTVDCSHVVIMRKTGICDVKSLATIRDFDSQNSIDIDNEESIEDQIINSSEYLKITDLDLKILLGELKSIIREFEEKNEKCNCKSILLSGINSAHPNIANLIRDSLKINTLLLNPFESENVSSISYQNQIIAQGLNRVVGLGLGILSDYSPDYKTNNLVSKSLFTSNKNSNNSITNKFNIQAKESKNSTIPLDDEVQSKTDVNDGLTQNSDLIFKNSPYDNLSSNISNDKNQLVNPKSKSDNNLSSNKQLNNDYEYHPINQEKIESFASEDFDTVNYKLTENLKPPLDIDNIENNNIQSSLDIDNVDNNDFINPGLDNESFSSNENEDPYNNELDFSSSSLNESSNIQKLANNNSEPDINEELDDDFKMPEI